MIILKIEMYISIDKIYSLQDQLIILKKYKSVLGGLNKSPPHTHINV